MHINTPNIDDLLTTGAPLHTIHEHLTAGHHTVTYKALTCKYQCNSSQDLAGGSRSICAITVLNCVRLAFQLETKGDEETILCSFVSQDMINQVMNIANDLIFDTHLEIDDLLEVPIFKETIISKVREQGHPSLETFKDLFIRSFPPESLKPITAVVFIQTPEHIVCFRFRSSTSYIFVIFDPHSRSERPFGPACIIANDLDTIAAHFDQLLTQPSISKPTSFTALVIESRENLSTDAKDLLTKSVTHLSEKLSVAEDLVPGHFEQLRVRAETLRMQQLADGAHKQDRNRQSSNSASTPLVRKKNAMLSPKPTRRSEFGWQLNLQVSSTPSAVDPKLNKDPNLAASPNPLEVKKTSSAGQLKKSDFDWLTSLMPAVRSDAQDIDISLSSASKADEKNISNTKLSQMLSRTEFGWQMALQQPLKTDRRKAEDLEITTPQTDIQTYRTLLGKEKEEAFEDVFTFSKVSESAWEDVLMKQLQQEEDLAIASSSGYQWQDGILAWQTRVDEDNAHDTVASSSSLSTYRHKLDFKPLPSMEGESSINRHSRHSPMSTAYPYLDAIQNSNREFTTLELPTSECPVDSHECGVCNELYGATQIIRLPDCTHTFCRECLRTFTKTKIREGRYPISCPVCAIERTRVNRSHITHTIVEKLELSEQDLEKLSALQLVAHSVTLHCPKCKQTMNVDRGEYISQRIIICPLPPCRHKWCKECLKSLASSQTEHNCKQHGFERLMRRKGWKYCPGCNTPVQKETGCNHMTCGSPGCNVHFCYKCGISIIDTSNGGDVGSAVTEHYIDCVMFEKRRRCIIQ